MSSNLRERLRVITLVAHAALTADTTGTGVAAGAEGPHRAMAIVDVSAVGGDADETYSITIEGSNTSISAGFVLAHAPGEPVNLPFTQPLAVAAAPATVAVLGYRWYRYVLDVGGTTPSITFGVQLAIMPSKLPTATQLAT